MSWDGRYWNTPRLSVCLSVSLSVLSVMFSFHTLKRIAVVPQNFAGTCMHHVMGVCCIVFDIDGILFFFSHFMFSLHFILLYINFQQF